MADTTVLQSDELQAAFEKLHSRWLQEWKDSENPEVREKCWHLIHALERIKKELETTMNSKDFDELVARRREKRLAAGA